MTLTWDVFTLLGTIAFAVSGAIVAMEEEYDFFGVYVLALVTAFGGGLIRNLIIGMPVSAIWHQGRLFDAALVATTVIVILPSRWILASVRWNSVFDAIGLATFAIQGALYADSMHYPVGTVIVAAVMTGIGGGIVRDVLARRKPTVLREEIYALWAALAGGVIGVGWITSKSAAWELYVLLCLVFGLRMLSLRYNWRIPRRKLDTVNNPIRSVKL